MHAFTHLISRARTKLISLKKSGPNSIESSINRLELDIMEVEARDLLHGNLHNSSDNLSSLYNNLEDLHHQNSSKWAQRARLIWVQCGDQNTSFFHNSIRLRNHQNSISLIYYSNLNYFTDRKDINRIFCEFYSTLWTNPSNNSTIDIFQALLTIFL